MEDKQKTKSVFSKKELVGYAFVSGLMLLLSSIAGGKYIGYVFIYLLLLWVAIYFLSKSNLEIMDRVGNFTFMVLVISPVLVYLLILVFDIMLTKYPDILHIEGSRDTWISFAGSIIGGSMTMFALVFTINNENTNRKTEKVEREESDRNEAGLKLIPLVKVVPCFSDKYEIKTIRSFDNNTIYTNFKLKNISTNHARNITVSVLEYWINIPQADVAKVNTSNNDVFKECHINILASGDETVFRIALASDLLDNELSPGLNSEGEIFFSLILNITLFDIRGIFRHSFNTKVTGYLQTDFENPENTYVDKYGDYVSEYAKFEVNITDCNTDLV